MTERSRPLTPRGDHPQNAAMILLRRAVFSVFSIAVVGCGFDSDGLASSSNSAGSLESTAGSDSSDGDSVSQSSTQSVTTAPTGDDSMTASTGDSVTSPTTTNTTSEPTETGVAETTSGDPGSSEESSGAAELGTTSEGGGSSDTGLVVPPYGPCDGPEDCDGGACITLYLSWAEAHVCYPPCTMTPDCPDPDGGDAVKECTMSGCALDCSDGGAGEVSCPAGMACGYTGSGSRRCLWP
jgi:hypothetical protein